MFEFHWNHDGILVTETYFDNAGVPYCTLSVGKSPNRTIFGYALDGSESSRQMLRETVLDETVRCWRRANP